MTRREMLVEQYEDALFALLMDEVAEAEGQKALEENQRLKESGELVIPEEVSQRCQRVIARKTSEKEFKRFGKGFGKVVTKVAVVALMGMLLFTTAFAASEDFRVKTLNFIMEVFDDRTEIKFVPDNTPPNVGKSAAPQVIAGWLPDSFELVREETTERNRQYEYVIPDSDCYISLVVMHADNTGIVIDTEGVNAIPKQVQGMNALFVDKENMKQLVWQLNENSEWYCYVIAHNVSTDDVLKFAENIAAQ